MKYEKEISSTINSNSKEAPNTQNYSFKQSGIPGFLLQPELLRYREIAYTLKRRFSTILGMAVCPATTINTWRIDYAQKLLFG